MEVSAEYHNNAANATGSKGMTGADGMDGEHKKITAPAERPFCKNEKRPVRRRKDMRILARHFSTVGVRTRTIKRELRTDPAIMCRNTERGRS